MNNITIIQTIKGKLNDCISSLDSVHWLCCNKTTDFTRKRKLSFPEMMRLILQFQAKSLPNELMDYFDHNASTPTVSAFIQQRNKITTSSFRVLFKLFTRSCLREAGSSLYKGYRLLAVDGSDMNISKNPKHEDTFIAEGSGYNVFHLNALYDLIDHIYLDAVIQGKKKLHERQAFNTMVDRYDESAPAIFIADKGYESFNTMAHVIEAGQKFLIRVKDDCSNGIISSYGFEPGPFDVDIITTLTHQHTYETMTSSPYKYTILQARTDFDYLPYQESTYDITFRAVRFKNSCNKYETVVTNLSREEFPASELEKIYRLRWGEETSFRDLKYNLDAVFFHSKNMKYITQEIFARLTAYNYCAFIAYGISLQEKEKRKYRYKINFATAVNICMAYFRKGGDETDMLLLLTKQITPIRLNRQYPLTLRPKRNKGFAYRGA